MRMGSPTNPDEHPMVIRGVHCAICGLLLAGGVIAFECQAGPVGAAEGIDTMSGDAPATTGRPAISLRTKPGEAGIDHTSPEHWAGLEEASTSGMGAISDLLWNDNSAPDSAPASFSGQRGRNANGAQLIFWDAVDGALRMT
ncbi:MAG TPA: hypothetical protein VKF40_08605, partial [Burkholderiales bacterium]|nr:hypothetical protein [Burkholderiales bacterium]